MSYHNPTLAEVDEWIRRKEEEQAFVDVIYEARELVQRMWLKTPEGKAHKERLELERELRELEYERREARLAAEREQRAADLVEIRRKEKEARAKRAAEKVARDARTERDRERDRRSRIKWSEIIEDEYIVKMQIAYERRATALAMSDAGLSSAAIGRRLGVSRGRAHQMVAYALSDRNDERRFGRRSPAEAYMADLAVTADYCDFAMRQTVAAIVPRDDEDDLIWMGIAA